ncbi:PREDICTED: uncharacterized protein LOC109329669 isoform X2 [Lupinus angustifolius]|uniref:uncharacterized protein LOC109329669 isoform X2 n=1 Tax=Lupinus angustifolius TaxID=3871 RepID=UPI00092E8BF1|nr:PREDICTED: uncharacterized protein LOC109329669 isoform X2 [Lupinus angustifolius]
MGVEKEGTKSGGGYVGGFFQLFDWTSKSRKKLFAAKSELPEPSKHGRKAHFKVAITQPYLANDDDENGIAAGVRRSCDRSYASSVTDDESCATRAPSVVARLMGLDSLPPSIFSDPYFDTGSLEDTQYFSESLNHQHDHQTLYSGKLVEKAEGSSRNFVEPKPQKNLTRPFEKFQTEVLPPRSAKSIPVTHHKLLSPIKCPGFVPSKNAAYIMEAAARIIEPGPQATTKAKTPLVASSTVSLRVKDLRDKVEASQKGPLIGSSSKTSRARDLREKREISHRTTRNSELFQRPVELHDANYQKGQSLNKSWNGSVDTVKSSTHAEEGSSLKSKGKSISLAVQAKVNVQRREGMSLSGGRSLVSQKEHLEPNRTSKANVQKNLHKKSSGVLRQNNLKQNSSVEKDKLRSKPLVSNSHSKKVMTADSPYARHRSSNSKSIAKSKVGSRKSIAEISDSEKEVLYTSTNNFPRKKRTTDRDWNDRIVDNLFIEKMPKSVQSSLVCNKQYSWAEETKNKDTDVVSFTFTTPLTRKSPGFETSGQASQKTNGLSLDERINVIGGDALGMLLEQKLRELTNAVESSCHDVSCVKQPSSTAPISNDLVTQLNLGNTRLQQKKDQDVLLTDNLSSSQDSGISFTGLPEFSSKHKSWVDEMDPQLFNGRQPSPISVLEPSFSIESCESSMSTGVTSTEGSKLCSSVQAQEVHGMKLSRKFSPAESDAELSDSASSTSTGTMMIMKHTTTFPVTKLGRSSTWELDYVKEILSNIELMYMEFSLGQAREVTNPYLFNQLERRKGGLEFDGESTIRRKVIFDCVSECLDIRCRSYVRGGYKMWGKGVAMMKRKEWLAEEVYKEISGWDSMKDSMVDELVEKDMSNIYGRWVDFEVDGIELGAEIVDQIFNYLVDDVVADMLQL